MIPSIYPGDLLTVRSDSAPTRAAAKLFSFFSVAARSSIASCANGQSAIASSSPRAATRSPKKIRPSTPASFSAASPHIQRRGKSIAIVAKPGPFTRAHRWAVRNSLAFARLLLAVHALRMRLSGRSTDFADRPASDHLQGFA